MPEILVAVHCYQGDAGLVEDTLEWHERKGKVLVLSPEDSPVKIDGVECRSAGLRGWDGDHTVVRQYLHWKIMAEYPFDWFLLNDADSFALEIPEYVFEKDVFWSNFKTPYTDEQLEAEILKDCYFVRPPYFMHRGVLERLIGAGSPPDRYIDKSYAILVKELGIVSKPYRPWNSVMCHAFKDRRNLIQHEQRLRGSEEALALDEVHRLRNEIKSLRRENEQLQQTAGDDAVVVISELQKVRDELRACRSENVRLHRTTGHHREPGGDDATTVVSTE